MSYWDICSKICVLNYNNGVWRYTSRSPGPTSNMIRGAFFLRDSKTFQLSERICKWNDLLTSSTVHYAIPGLGSKNKFPETEASWWNGGLIEGSTWSLRYHTGVMFEGFSGGILNLRDISKRRGFLGQMHVRLVFFFSQAFPVSYGEGRSFQVA